MSIDNLVRNGIYPFSQATRAVLNVQFPKDIEMYVMALELVDGKGDTLKYFIFPVNPSSFDEEEASLVNIKKTYGGVTSLDTPAFLPKDISLNGNFGRKFRILLGNAYEDLIHSFSTAKSLKDKVVKTTEELDVKVKSGFGTLKVLESIIEGSRQVDENGPRKLYFYNLALGNNYLVKVISFKQSMSQESNMIWNYSLRMKAIAPLDMMIGKTKDARKELVISAMAQQRTDKLVNSLTAVIASKTNPLIDNR